ncbi:hypothetical protein lerEdw1_010873 [Lerista edwardsae]|nr:hypothetical protein lerEdw1_010873 [Lerista edwardsae]
MGKARGLRAAAGLTSWLLGSCRRCCRSRSAAAQAGEARRGSRLTMGRAGLGRIPPLLPPLLLAWLGLGRLAGEWGGQGPGLSSRGPEAGQELSRGVVVLNAPLRPGVEPVYGLFVTDYFTRTPRKLSPFRSFASIELFHFRVPEDTVVAVWNLITFKEQGGTFGDQCPDRSITVYFRSGAPPVINPLRTHFPRDTAVPGSFALTLTWTLPNRTTGVFNITSPLPGDWFLAAHLPKEQGRISVKGSPSPDPAAWASFREPLRSLASRWPGKAWRGKVWGWVGVPGGRGNLTMPASCQQGLAEDCQYLFQPQLIVQRLVGIRVLYPGFVTEHVLLPHNRSLLYKVFIPSCTSRVLLQLWNCHSANQSCPLWLKVRGKAPPLHNSTALDCREHAPCRLALELPLWQHWYYVLVEKHLGVASQVGFRLVAQLKVSSAGPSGPPSVTSWTPSRCTSTSSSAPTSRCPPDRPAVFAIQLLPVLDSGGILNLELRLNVSSLRGENATVFACLNHEVPLVPGGSPLVTCETELLAGFLLTLNATAPLSRLRIPYPQTGTWYLSLRSLCAVDRGLESCWNVTAEVYLRTYLSPCVNDCGPYGQCKLLRTNNYLYAACECKAGWSGWGCTDNASAFSYGFQLLSTLLLCLSNLMFVPPVAIAVRSHYLLEAAVYVFTMFFSTFYHACDQPGIVVFCIMDYDVLQFCDFLGSLMSVWVTVIAMARLQPVVKQVLYLLGAMLLSMALQLDRHGLWNLLGPSLFALGVMAVAWAARSVRRRHCYPPTWQRWAFCLLPGALIAASAVLLYAFVETEENYFYIHSIWHMLIAGSVGFLLPPRAKPEAPGRPGPLPRRKGCGYQLCVNEQEELGLVDPGGAGASVTSVCSS